MAKRKEGRKSERKWMQGAVPESRKGVFGEKARRAGMSTHAYAEQERHAPGKLGKEARLALIFERTAKRGGSSRRGRHEVRRKSERRTSERSSRR